MYREKFEAVHKTYCLVYKFKIPSYNDGNVIFLQIVSMLLLLQCEHLDLLPWDPFFHNWKQNPFHDNIKIMKILPLCEWAFACLILRTASFCGSVKSQLIHLSDVFQIKLQRQKSGLYANYITSYRLSMSQPVMLTLRCFFVSFVEHAQGERKITW